MFGARVLVAWGVNAAALWVADALFDSVRIDGFWAFAIGAAVLGIANAFVKPVLTLLTLPLVLVTLGLFLLVINIVIVALAEAIAPDFAIDGFWTYVGTVIVIWLVNWIADAVLGEAAGRR